MTFETYVLACNVVMVFGFAILISNVNIRLGKIEKKLNMEHNYEDQKDKATT